MILALLVLALGVLIIWISHVLLDEPDGACSVWTEDEL